MLICCIADLHGQTRYIPHLHDIEYDLLVVCGDITNFGHYKDACDILSLFPEPFLAVHGNCDYEDVLAAFNEMGCNLHGRTIKRENEIFSGFGGSNPFVGVTPSEYAEDIIYEELSRVEEVSILVTHAPPKNTKTDKALKMKHVGSTAVRQIIEEKKPEIALCGHIHESRNADLVGSTLIINPGEFSEGYYALVSVEEKKCSLLQVK